MRYHLLEICFSVVSQFVCQLFPRDGYDKTARDTSKKSGPDNSPVAFPKYCENELSYILGVIQGVFEIGNRFCVRENGRQNFDKLTKNKVFAKHLISKYRANHKLPPMYIKHCKLVF